MGILLEMPLTAEPSLKQPLLRTCLAPTGPPDQLGMAKLTCSTRSGHNWGDGAIVRQATSFLCPKDSLLAEGAQGTGSLTLAARGPGSTHTKTSTLQLTVYTQCYVWWTVITENSKQPANFNMLKPCFATVQSLYMALESLFSKTDPEKHAVKF